MHGFSSFMTQELTSTWRSRRRDVRDIRVMLKSRGIVIDVSHRDEHAGGTGERLWGPGVTGDHHQGVILFCFPVQQRAGDDLPRGGVDGELGVPADDPVTEAERRGAVVPPVTTLRGSYCNPNTEQKCTERQYE